MNRRQFTMGLGGAALAAGISPALLMKPETAYAEGPTFNSTIIEMTKHPLEDVITKEFERHVGQGHGSAWRGIAFINSGPRILGPTFIAWMTSDQERTAGESLTFTSDLSYDRLHGHEYPFMAFVDVPKEQRQKLMRCLRGGPRGVVQTALVWNSASSDSDGEYSDHYVVCRIENLVNPKKSLGRLGGV